MSKKSSRGEKKKKEEEREDGGQAEEVRAQLLKEMLQQEERKADGGWQPLLHHSEDPKHRQEVVVLRETLVRELEEQENIIRKLVRDMEEDGRRSTQLWHGHRQRGDHLQALQDTRVKLLQEMREQHMQRHISNLSRQKKQVVACSRQQKAFLEDNSVFFEELRKEALKDSRNVTKETVETKNGSNEKKEKTKVKRRKQKENPAARPLLVRRQRCSLTVQIDSITQAVGEIKLMADKIHEGRNQMRHQKTVLSRLRSSKISVQVEQDLTGRRNKLERQRQETRVLQNQLTRAQKALWKQLTDLTVQGENATKKLKTVIAKGERLLHAGEMCCHLESQVLPFLSAQKHQQDSTGPETEASAKETFVLLELQQLTRRLNSAQLLRDALRTRKDHLTQENKQLKLELHGYFDGMTISDHVPGRAPQTLVLTVNKALTTTVRQNTGTRHSAKHTQ